MIEVIPMNASHWIDVARIYQEGIETGHATFASCAPDSWDDFIQSKVDGCNLVARDTDTGTILGWAVLSPVSSRCVYSGVAELSIYIAAEQRERGVGSLLLAELVRISEEKEIWTLQSGTFPENKASIALQEKFGFRIVGRRERIGRMSFGSWAGRWRDTLFMERRSTKVGGE